MGTAQSRLTLYIASNLEKKVLGSILRCSFYFTVISAIFSAVYAND